MMIQRAFLPLLLLASGLGVWEVVVHASGVPHYILPAPSSIAATLVQQRIALLGHTMVTLQEMLLGFGLAASSGIALAILMFEVPTLERALYPHRRQDKL